MAPPRRLHHLRHRHLPRRRVLLHRRHTRLDRSGGSTHTAFERGERRLGKADCRRCRPEQPSSLIAPSQSSSLVAPPSSLLLLAALASFCSRGRRLTTPAGRPRRQVEGRRQWLLEAAVAADRRDGRRQRIPAAVSRVCVCAVVVTLVGLWRMGWAR